MDPLEIQEDRLKVRDSGAVVYDGTVIGEFDGETIRLDLGWMRMAGVGLIVEGDSTVDRRRVVLDRRPQ